MHVQKKSFFQLLFPHSMSLYPLDSCIKKFQFKDHNATQRFQMSDDFSWQPSQIESIHLIERHVIQVSANDETKIDATEYPTEVSLHHDDLFCPAIFLRLCFTNTAFFLSDTLWQINSNDSISIKINTTSCSFLRTPIYFATVVGTGSHYYLVGHDIIRTATSQSFDLTTTMVVGLSSDLIFNRSQTHRWDVQWIGYYL